MSDRFTITFPPVTLEIGQVWPDGNAPPNPTADDVLRVMRREGQPQNVIESWQMVPEELAVDGVSFGADDPRPADCPCGLPKGGNEPCTPEEPCDYARERIGLLWSA